MHSGSASKQSSAKIAQSILCAHAHVCANALIDFIFIVAGENPLFSDRGGEFGGRKGGWNLHAHLTAMQTVKF